MTTMTSLRRGHDVDYFTSSAGAGGCAGAMSYYTAAGEPAGQWAGRGAETLGLAGDVDANVIRGLYMENVGPDGVSMGGRRAPRDISEAERAAIIAFERKYGGYASVTETEDVAVRERAKGGPRTIPYYDWTISADKSVSVLHASYRTAAHRARTDGDTARAAELDGRADQIESALMDAAREAIRWLEGNAAYVRTGYHSSTSGEWRDADGLTSALFLHHISRDGDPHLHVHATIWNRAQRADGADPKWRGLFGRAFYQQRLGMAPVPDRIMEERLRGMGLVMVPRDDGNGGRAGGVDEQVSARFSSRAVSVGGELAELAAEYERVHGKPPSRRTLWLLHQQAGQRTRRSKADAKRTAAGQTGDDDLDVAARLAAWEAQLAVDEAGDLASVHEQVHEFARERARAGAGPVPDGAKLRAARIAVAEVQRRHAAWGMPELRFEVHRALGAGAVPADIDEIAGLVTSGRAGTDVVQIGAAPDVADVSGLGVRVSDGQSVYRPPGETRWCTTDHLDVEDWIIAASSDRVARLVGEDDAYAAVRGTDLTAQQQHAVAGWLSGDRRVVPLNAAAGSGKTRAVAAFAELWTGFTGGRVIGLTTSTNAARVMANEGLAESYNIAEFLGKVEGSDELRRPVPVHANDVLVLDEATQASTADVALLLQAARAAGARLYPVGDTAQLGAVDAGGIFALIAGEVPGTVLEEVLRFRAKWEADASKRLRDGDVGAVAVYARRGRVRGGDHESVFGQAAWAYAADMLRGRETLLLAGSSAEAADLARRVQAILHDAGLTGDATVHLADGNMAGPGDLIRARLNTTINAGGRRLTNRDTVRVTAVHDDGSVEGQRRIGPDRWAAPFLLPAAYLAKSAELDYAGNVHVSQGRTVDTSHLAVTQSLSRQALYVGMTRGRDENTAHVETGNTAPAGQRPYEQASAESVLAGVMEREAAEAAATAQMRAAQEWASGAGHVLHLWSVAVRSVLYPDIDRRISAALTPDQAARYGRDFARDALHARLREAQLAGHDVAELVARITADSVEGARSVAAVLHSRLSGLGLGTRHDVSWAQRTPDGAPELARELAAGLDQRVTALGERAAADPEPWVLRQLGRLDPDASPMLAEEWQRRAGTAAAYREAAGITDPDVAVAADPHEGNPELETFRRAAIAALEIRDEADELAAKTRGELEALVLDGERAMGSAPADESARLRAAAQAKHDAWEAQARARVAGNEEAQAAAQAEAGQSAGDQARLDDVVSAYEQWSAATAERRELAGRAKAELGRRAPETTGDPDGPGAGSLAEWWREFEVNLSALDAKIGREHQAAIDEGRPWPPRPEVESEPEAAGDDTRSQPEADRASERPAAAGPTGQSSARNAGPRDAGAAPTRGARPSPPPPPESSQPESEGGSFNQEAGSPEPDLDGLQDRAEAAAQRISEEAAESDDHSARAEPEADAESAPSWQAQLDDDLEPEA